MMFRLRVRSDMVDDFAVHIEADAANTFFQLHEVLQEECRFDPSQLVTFFSADEEWDKEKEIKMFPDPHSPGSAFMRNTRLDEFLRTEEDKLLYTFDIKNDKSLYIELFGKTKDQILKTPVVTLRKGKAPEQLSEGDHEPLSDDEIGRDSQHTCDDLGELEDLCRIYGEMTDHVI